MEAIFGWFCIGGLILLLCVAVITALFIGSPDGVEVPGFGFIPIGGKGGRK